MVRLGGNERLRRSAASRVRRLRSLFFGLIGNPAAAQKSGGILRQYIIDSPASMSIHEETTVVAERPMMGVFNNLVIFDQHVAQNSLATVRPELATGWTWDEEGTRLDGQQYLQRLAHGGCLARSIAEHIRGRHTVADIHRATPRGHLCDGRRLVNPAENEGRSGMPIFKEYKVLSRFASGRRCTCCSHFCGIFAGSR